MSPELSLTLLNQFQQFQSAAELGESLVDVYMPPGSSSGTQQVNFLKVPCLGDAPLPSSPLDSTITVGNRASPRPGENGHQHSDLDMMGRGEVLNHFQEVEIVGLCDVIPLGGPMTDHVTVGSW